MTERTAQLRLDNRHRKATNEEIIAAYQRTGSVWRAAKELGMVGQSVHERLRALRYPLAASRWTPEEVEELQRLVGHLTIGQIAKQLGRPYAGVAGKISSLGLAYAARNRQPLKVPRGSGYDRASVTKYAKAIDKSGTTVHRFARSNGLSVEFLCAAFERHLPEWWETYRLANSDLPEIGCEYCGRRFVPSNKKQRLCSRKCGADQRADKSYFGGRRREAIGWAEGICQVCGRKPEKGLTPHHVLGKENDPDNTYLVAVCQGCHSVITSLGGRNFDSQQWESLISLVWLRCHGPELAKGNPNDSIWVSVEIWTEPEDEEEETA